MMNSKTMNLQQYLEAEVTQTYRQLCEEWRSVKQLLTEVEAKEAELKQQILKEAGGAERLEYGVKVALVQVSGTIDYKAIPEVIVLDANYLDGFRRPSRTDYRVTSY